MSHRRSDKQGRTVHQALVELYISLKLRCEPEEYSKSGYEESALLGTDPFTLIEYIKSSIDIFANTQVERALQMAEAEREQESSLQREDSPQELEKLTQNLEAEMEQQQRLKIESMEALVEENDKEIATLKDRRKKLETDNKELHDVCLKKQAENEQLKKVLTEKTATIDQLKKTLQSRPPVKQPQYVVKKVVGQPKEKENTGPMATLRTTSIDLHESQGEKVVGLKPKVESKPQLQEAYNKLIKEIRGKNEVTKKRTDSFHYAAADKKKVNTTINPYVTQAWEQYAEGTTGYNEEILKKFADIGHRSSKDRSSVATKIANKSAIAEERTHLRSNSHKVEDKRSTVDSSALASIMRKSNCKDLMEKYQERHKDRNRSQMDRSSNGGELTSRPRTSLDKYQARPSVTYREMCRERSVSNSRGVIPRQSQPTKLVKAHANATSIMRTVDQL